MDEEILVIKRKPKKMKIVKEQDRYLKSLSILETHKIQCELFLSDKIRNDAFRDNPHRYITVQITNCCGKINKIEDDYIHIIPSDNLNGYILKELLKKDSNNVMAYLRSIGRDKGNNEYEIHKCITFDIVYTGDNYIIDKENQYE